MKPSLLFLDLFTSDWALRVSLGKFHNCTAQDLVLDAAS